METKHKRLIVLACLAVFVIAGIFWGRSHWSAERRLARSWDGFIESIEGRSVASTIDYMADDYSDTWGYNKTALEKDLFRVFRSMSELKITRVSVTTTRVDTTATIQAKVRLTARGYGYVTDAANQVNGLADPFVVQWRQDPGFFGRWRITRIEQPQFNISRYKSSGAWF